MKLKNTENHAFCPAQKKAEPDSVPSAKQSVTGLQFFIDQVLIIAPFDFIACVFSSFINLFSSPIPSGCWF
jgi:hypothetical protein